MLRDEHAINELCLKCERPSCSGMCDEVRRTMGQVDGTRRARTLTWGGVTRPVGEWAEILGVSKRTMYNYLGETDDMNAIIRALMKPERAGLPPGAVEQTYLMISTMHLDYKIYWQRMLHVDGSAGFVARYGEMHSAPTNVVSKPTESRALPELSMSDEALYRRSWVACVLFVIDRYRSTCRQKENMRGQILEWRAIRGYTIRKIAELINDDRQSWEQQITVVGVRLILQNIIQEVAGEALRRGLIRDAKK